MRKKAHFGLFHQAMTASAGEHSNIGVIAFAVGFSLMMALDVALG